jgi:hypothetical protein
MTALSDERTLALRIDTAFYVVGLLVRAVVYSGVYVAAGHYDCGPAMLTGILMGDLGSQLVVLAWDWREHLLILLGEIAILMVIVAAVRAHLAWPDDPALRAIVCLAGFGAFAVNVGAALLVRLGPSEGEFA